MHGAALQLLLPGDARREPLLDGGGEGDVLFLTGADVEEIRAGTKLADIELRQALSLTQPISLVNAFTVGEPGGLLGAVFPVDTPNGPDPDNSYSRWLARQPKRHVQD